MIVTIHQPEHLPWLGFFDKLRQAQTWVLLDQVPYRKHYFQNRNRIRGDRGEVWLTVPVLTRGKLGQAIRDVRIDHRGSPRWRAKCWTSLAQHYGRAPFWAEHAGALEALYRRDWERLVELNEALIRYLLVAFSIQVTIVKSSELNVSGQRSALLLAICRRLNAEVYLSGISGREYLDQDLFREAGIEVRFQAFHHPIYAQQYEPFIPCLSALDLLLNRGPDSLEALRGVGVETMQELIT